VQLYFAYGSNLLRSQMMERCPDHVVHGRATLPAFRFLIGARGYATIAPAPAEVEGVVYRLSAADETALDRYEGVAAGRYRKDYVTVQAPGGAICGVLVYVDPQTEPAPPRPGYLEKILVGAAAFEFPAEYQRFLRTFA
jgi:gamma-glutamylcyclotransferase (GGCT)/AIG2-like uncharacterized protein YtfP